MYTNFDDKDFVQKIRVIQSQLFILIWVGNKDMFAELISRFIIEATVLSSDDT